MRLLAMAAVLLASVGARAEPARVHPGLLCAVQNAIRWREAAWTTGQCERIAAALNETADPMTMLAIAVNESDLRARALNVQPKGVFDVGLMGVRCVTRTWEEDTQDICLNGPARGLTVAKLMDPVVNIRTAAAVLAGKKNLGNYNAGDPELARRYADKVAVLTRALSGLTVDPKKLKGRKRLRNLVEQIQVVLWLESWS